MAAKAEKANVVSLFAQPDDEEEITVGLGPVRAEARTSVPANVADLSGRPKVVFLLGRGKTGKSTMARWAAEEAAAASRPVILADLDRTNATLSSYFDGVQRPPEGDEATVSRWLERLLAHVMANRVTALIDLGGGDTTLRRLVVEVPDMVTRLEQAGVAVVAVYMIGPQLDDLSPLATMEACGFKPDATLLVLNEALIETPVSREEAFARVLRHSALRATLARGATALWMPRLLPAGEIEARRVAYAQAAAGQVREGRKQTPLGPFDQGRVRAWLQSMNDEFAGVRSWMS